MSGDKATARRVAEVEFGLGPGVKIRPLGQGRINLTFLVSAARGEFILQRLHPVFGRDGAVVENVARVTARLAAAGVPTSRVIPTRTGSWWAEADGLWRLMTWLPGRTGSARTPAAGAEAARLLGLFHRTLARDPVRLDPLPPGEHNRDGPARPGAWAALLERSAGEAKFERAAPALERGRALAGRLPRFEAVTRAVVHGDPKLENFLFDESGRAAGLIDLDTVREGAVLWDLADGLRSWAGRPGLGGEMVLDRETFRRAVEAYRAHGLALAPEEWAQVPAATRARALDLARRYLTDYFEESYFVWDRARYPSLAEQNLSRGRGLLCLARDLEEMEGTG